MKYCTKCQKPREDIDFNKSISKPNGQSWCRECMIEYNRQWYKLNRESHNQYVSDHKERKHHICKMCDKGEPDVRFYIKREGDRYYRRFICYDCDREYKKRYPTTEAAQKRYQKKLVAQGRIRRKSPDRRFRYILQDSRKYDKKRGLLNDLTLEYIRDKINTACTYCGDSSCKMTLDRIDNSIGHLQSNVIAACIRCNLFRRDMPYKAWLVIVPALRTARGLGLLNDWMSGPRYARNGNSVTAVDIEQATGF